MVKYVPTILRAPYTKGTLKNPKKIWEWLIQWRLCDVECVFFFLIQHVDGGICHGDPFELRDAIQMGPHDIYLFKDVDKKCTGCNLKTMELLDCVLMGICVVIRSNMWNVEVLLQSLQDRVSTLGMLCFNFKDHHRKLSLSSNYLRHSGNLTSLS